MLPGPGRRTALALFACCLAFAVATPLLHAGAQRWTALGLSGGRLDHLVSAPSRQGTLYATAGGRLFRSTDAGDSWQTGQPFALSPGGAVNDLTVDPQEADTLTSRPA